MSEKVERLLTRFGNIWSKRLDDEGVGDWLADWEDALNEFEPWIVETATKRIIQTRSKAGFPLPAEVAEVCRHVRNEERQSRPRMKVDHVDQHQDPYDRADALVRCDLGRQAASAEPCWILALHDFCRVNRRLPTGHEISRCKQVAVDFEQRYRDCITGNAGAFSKPLLAWAETIIRKREDLRAKLIGRAAA